MRLENYKNDSKLNTWQMSNFGVLALKSQHKRTNTHSVVSQVQCFIVDDDNDDKNDYF